MNIRFEPRFVSTVGEMESIACFSGQKSAFISNLGDIELKKHWKKMYIVQELI